MTDQNQTTTPAYPKMLKEIQGHCETHPWWRRKCEGTPLENDLPVRAANLASIWTRQAHAEIEKLRRVLEQAQCCILGETPEDGTHEEAREDTLQKIREALNVRP